MRSTTRRVAVFVASLVLAGVGTTLTAPAASAGSSEEIVTDRGIVGFYHEADKLHVADLKADGISIMGEFVFHSQPHDIHVAGQGKSKTINRDLLEGTRVTIRMYYYDDGVPIEVSGKQQAQA